MHQERPDGGGASVAAVAAAGLLAVLLATAVTVEELAAVLQPQAALCIRC
jgi:hypothetical protein